MCSRGFVLAHWCGAGFAARLRASLKPLIAGGIAGALIVALPILLTELLALDSNRPEISSIDAGRGSLHYTHLLSLVFPDLFGAMDPKVDFWGAGGFAWNERFGMADLFLAQNMGLLYAGALVPVLLVVGAVRGWLWSREIRFFVIAALLAAFYAFGWYTPVFHAMYELMPGVKLFRRPADASFVLGGMIAIIAGYLVHRWLPNRPRRGGSATSCSSFCLRSSPSRSGSPRRPSASIPRPRRSQWGFASSWRRSRSCASRGARRRRSPPRRCSACSRPPISPSTMRRMNRPACRPRATTRCGPTRATKPSR